MNLDHMAARDFPKHKALWMLGFLTQKTEKMQNSSCCRFQLEVQGVGLLRGAGDSLTWRALNIIFKRLKIQNIKVFHFKFVECLGC